MIMAILFFLLDIEPFPFPMSLERRRCPFGCLIVGHPVQQPTGA
jgi:hypothetical protein